MDRERTGYAGKQLAGKVLDLRAGKGHETVALEEIKHALPQQIGDDADMIPIIEAIAQMDAFIPVLLVIRVESRQHTQLNPGGIAVLLDGADDFDGTAVLSLFVIRFNHLAKGALAE